MVEKPKDPVTREYTINLHKRLHGINFKKRAPRAVKEVKKFAAKMMRTKDVRVDVKLNKELWSKGIKNVPMRLRIRISRKCEPTFEHCDSLRVRMSRLRRALCCSTHAQQCVPVALPPPLRAAVHRNRPVWH